MRNSMKVVLKDGQTYRDEAKGLSVTHYVAIEKTMFAQIHTWWVLYRNGTALMVGGHRYFNGLWKLAKWFKEVERNPWPIDTSEFHDEGECDVERQ